MIQDTSSQDVILSKPKGKRIGLKSAVAAIATLALTLTAYPSISNWSSSDRSVKISRVRMANVERGDFVRDISLQGNIVAANSPKLYAPAMGTVTLNRNPGELVEKGDLVALVSSPVLEHRCGTHTPDVLVHCAWMAEEMPKTRVFRTEGPAKFLPPNCTSVEGGAVGGCETQKNVGTTEA